MKFETLELLVCPLCGGKLKYDKAEQVLICHADHLAYPIQDGVPIMLAAKAKEIPKDDE
jgi:uncharacterized protein YbaR (Trm112 family)